jgi:hypothetical protein
MEIRGEFRGQIRSGQVAKVTLTNWQVMVSDEHWWGFFRTWKVKQRGYPVSFYIIID